MDTLRKFNIVDLYFDLAGELEDKSTKKLYPQGNYQTVLYANFRAAEPTNVMGVAFELANGVAVDEQPMYYVGIVENDGIRYQRWEMILPSPVVSSYRKDREVQLSIQFTEREIADFIGVYDTQNDLPTNVDSGSYAWVLDVEAVFLYSENQQGALQWTEQNELETYNQVWGSDLVNIPVAKALRVNRDVVDIDTSDLVLKALAKTQGDKLNKTGDNADDDISINGVTFDHLRATDAIQGAEYDAKITEIEGNVANKLNTSGGTIEGNLTILGDTDMQSDLDMNGHKIINVDSLEAINVTIGDLNIQENLDLKVSRDGTLPMTGNLNFNGNSITNIDEINGYVVEDTVGEVTNIISGTTRVGKAESTDDALGNASTAQAIKQTVTNVNQDVKDTASPTFTGVTLGSKTLTETKLNNLDTAYTHSQITDGTNPHNTISAEIDVNTILYTDEDKHLNSQANNVQTALDQLYNHNHDTEYVQLSQLGTDVAQLGLDGKVLAGQLPSYVDDIIEFDTFADLPTTGNKGKIYVVTNDTNADNNTTYRWSDTGYFKFDQRTAEWGSISGTITDQTDLENATFTSTVSTGSSITSNTLKGAINDLDNKAKQIIAGTQAIEFSDGDLTATNVAGAISEIQDNVDNVVSGTTDITYGTTTVSAELTSLDSRVTTAENDLDAVEGRLDTAESDIDTNTTNISTNATAITNIENGTTDITYGATTVSAELGSLDTRLATAETDIDNIEDGTTSILYDNTTSGLTATTVKTAIDEIYGEKGEVNGIATLDSNGRLPASQLTLNALKFKGMFGTFNSLPQTGVQEGDFYICDLNNYNEPVSGLTFNSGDKALYANNQWYKNDANDAVTSVNGEVGSVTLSASDIDPDTSNFNKHLSANDDTIQKALDTLDDHTHTESDITNLDKYTQTEVDNLLLGKSDTGHTHTESDITDLDKYTQAETDAFLANKVDVGTLASSIILYPTTANSDITNYFKMVTSITDPDYETTPVNVSTGAITGTGQLIASLASETNLFVGNPGVLNVPTIGNIRKTAGNSNENAEFYFEVFLRESNGTETSIGVSEVTQTITSTTYEEFFANALINNGDFTATDRLVIKYYANNTGGGNPVYDFQFGGNTPVRTLLNVPINVVLSADRIVYDNTLSSLDALNLKDAVDELDDKILDSLTTIRVEQFNILNPDVGDGTFTYQDANNQTQTGTYDGTWYTFDLQIAGFYANNNLVTATINDTNLYHTSDSDQLEEGNPDSENIVTSVRVAYNFQSGDEIDIRYYQGVSIVAQEIGDGLVSYAKLDTNLRAKADLVTNATSLNNPDTLVKRNASGEFAGILDGKLKTARTIALNGDVSGQAAFDGSTGITITTVIADDSHTHTNLGGLGLTYNTGTDKYDVDRATTLQAQEATSDIVFMTPAKTKDYVDNAVIDGGTF